MPHAKAAGKAAASNGGAAYGVGMTWHEMNFPFAVHVDL